VEINRKYTIKSKPITKTKAPEKTASSFVSYTNSFDADTSTVNHLYRTLNTFSVKTDDMDLVKPKLEMDVRAIYFVIH
jgi:hypothetical protein